MPRLRYIEESEKTPYTRELIESAKRTGAPDPRVVAFPRRTLGAPVSVSPLRLRCRVPFAPWVAGAT